MDYPKSKADHSVSIFDVPSGAVSVDDGKFVDVYVMIKEKFGDGKGLVDDNEGKSNCFTVLLHLFNKFDNRYSIKECIL